MSLEYLKSSLKITVYVSLLIQGLTGIFNGGILGYTSYFTTVSGDVNVLVELVWLGLFVQLVEGIFYVWLSKHLHSLSNITMYRYYDWLFSTPVMLIILIVYLLFLNDKKVEKEKSEQINKSKNTPFKIDNNYKNVLTYVNENKNIIGIVLVLNVLMLLFGYLGEIDILPISTSVLLGFIPFVSYFYLIYENYAKYTNMGIVLFWFFSAIWSLYGLSALMPYYIKNIGYNILDIISKNFFELFLGIKLIFYYM